MIHFFRRSLRVLALTLVFTACNTPRQGVFSRSTEKEKPEEVSFKSKAKRKVPADDKALNQPLRVTLPYSETSYIENENVPANGYMFNAKRGQQLRITVQNENPHKDILYTQLWEKNNYGDPVLIGSTNAGRDTIAFDFDKDGSYILRIEAEEPQRQAYTVSVSTAPSFTFPIDKAHKPRMSSFWGASRDNGKRSHEGIDIMAKKHTPLVAVANGYITAVKNGGLGGKTVSLRPDNRDYSVYYAHLDQQYVKVGQYVQAGEVIGTVGNTGNAAKTAPHLHFGIYASTGAVDPFLFINPEIKSPKEVKADTINFRLNAKLKPGTAMYTSPSLSSKKTIVNITDLTILAATDNFYRVRLANGNEGYLPSSAVVKQSAVVKSKDPVATRSSKKREDSKL
jgi:peptidoglycan LD-endopeptidase LytH